MLATVFGDVHDIGKNLVHTILANNGYTVHDLGKQVPVNTILEKAVEVEADAIGLSALLVSTSKQMPICLEEQEARGLQFSGYRRRRRHQPRLWPAHRLARRRRRFLRAGLFYARDAFEGLELMDALTGDAQRRGNWSSARSAKPSNSANARERPRACRQPATFVGESAAAPKFPHRRFGVRARSSDIDVARALAMFRSAQSLSAFLGRRELERRCLRSAGPRRVRAAAAPLSRTKRRRGALLQPRAVYGYFPAAGSRTT